MDCKNSKKYAAKVILTSAAGWADDRMMQFAIDYPNPSGGQFVPLLNGGCRWEILSDPTATTEISRLRNPKTMAENKQVAQSGGNAAKIARKDIGLLAEKLK